MSDDAELQAIQQLISALEPLDADARGRVLDYVFRRLNITAASARGMQGPPLQTETASEQDAPRGPTPPQGRIIDVRSFAKEKKPTSQTEKTVVIAFYLTELAPEGERKGEISGADLEKYQKQADLGAPTNTRAALFQAKNAGYLESSGHGKYKLNPVGYNFVAHTLPGDSPESQAKPRARRARKVGARKKSIKKPSSAKGAAARKSSKKPHAKGRSRKSGRR